MPAGEGERRQYEEHARRAAEAGALGGFAALAAHPGMAGAGPLGGLYRGVLLAALGVAVGAFGLSPASLPAVEAGVLLAAVCGVFEGARCAPVYVCSPRYAGVGFAKLVVRFMARKGRCCWARRMRPWARLGCRRRRLRLGGRRMAGSRLRRPLNCTFMVARPSAAAGQNETQNKLLVMCRNWLCSADQHGLYQAWRPCTSFLALSTSESVQSSSNRSCSVWQALRSCASTFGRRACPAHVALRHLLNIACDLCTPGLGCLGLGYPLHYLLDIACDLLPPPLSVVIAQKHRSKEHR